MRSKSTVACSTLIAVLAGTFAGGLSGDTSAWAAGSTAGSSQTSAPAPSTGGAKKWEAPIPKVAEDSETWKKLVPALLAKNMNYGALAASRTMLNFFGDLPSKELAYGTIVQLIDMGYPFTTRPYFIPGDIEPHAGSEFAKNYFFYKGLVNVDKKMDRWAESHFNKIDKDNFAKYVFYQGLLAYGDHKLDDAVTQIKKALSLTTGKENANLAEKEARTLARIYYEQEAYDKAFDIYDNFLLKVSPTTPSDWLEAAWALYGMKKYSQALGYLYNLESKAVGTTIILEKYILRALIYREFCSVTNVDKLTRAFNQEFGKVIDGIKLGEPLRPDPRLVRIEHPETIEYRQAIQSIAELTEEQKHIDRLPSDLRPLATYLYAAELKMLARQKQMKENDALQILARHLVILSESLRFLRFDVARERFNPEAVFAEESTADKPLVDQPDQLSFVLHWKQSGDFWRDERQSYRGEMKNKCEP